MVRAICHPLPFGTETAQTQGQSLRTPSACFVFAHAGPPSGTPPVALRHQSATLQGPSLGGSTVVAAQTATQSTRGKRCLFRQPLPLSMCFGQTWGSGRWSPAKGLPFYFPKQQKLLIGPKLWFKIHHGHPLPIATSTLIAVCCTSRSQ